MEDLPSFTFDTVQQQIQDLYAHQEYQAVLDLATRQAPRFPEQAPLLEYWQISMLARTGQEQPALALLEKRLKSGFWYSEALLRLSPNLKSLQGQPAFESLVALNQAIQERDETHHYSLLTLRSEGRCSAGGPPCPLLLALHAGGESAQAAVEHWQPAAQAGWLVGVVQSSQALWKGAYVWEDRAIARQEVERHYASLARQYHTDSNQVVLGGQGEGGELAAWLALSGVSPAAGFIAMAPRGPLMKKPQDWEPLTHENPNSHLRGVLLAGQDLPSSARSRVQYLADLLTQAGMECRLDWVPGADDTITPAYKPAILDGLQFIVNRSP